MSSMFECCKYVWRQHLGDALELDHGDVVVHDEAETLADLREDTDTQ